MEVCNCPDCQSARMKKTVYGVIGLMLIVVVAWYVVVPAISNGYFDPLIVSVQGFWNGPQSTQANDPVLSQPNGDLSRAVPGTDTAFEVSPATVVVQDIAPQVVPTEVPLPAATEVPIVPAEPVFVVPEVPPTPVPHTIVQEPPAPVPTYAPVGELPQVFPSDTTEQAANAYVTYGEAKVQACMQAAAEGRRSSPSCREVLEALGQGR